MVRAQPYVPGMDPATMSVTVQYEPPAWFPSRVPDSEPRSLLVKNAIGDANVISGQLGPWTTDPANPSRPIRWVYLQAPSLGMATDLRSAPPFAVGVPEEGWHLASHVVIEDDDSAGTRGRQSYGYLMLLDEVLKLPRHLEFPVVDIGHEVVAVRGNRLGLLGTVRAVSGGEVVLECAGRPNVTVAGSYLGVVLREGVDPEDLLPLEIRLPVDARVWARLEDRVVAGLVAEYPSSGGVLHVWLPAEERMIAIPRDRDLVLERVAGQPCPAGPAVTKRRKVPRAKRPRRFGPPQGPEAPVDDVQEQLDEVAAYVQSLRQKPGRP